MYAFIVQFSHTDLFQIVAARHAASRLSRGLNRGKEEGNEDPDDGNHDQ
jgi:hypothetical protein